MSNYFARFGKSKVSIEMVAEDWSVQSSDIQALIDSGELRGLNIAGKTVIPVEALDEFEKNQTFCSESLAQTVNSTVTSRANKKKEAFVVKGSVFETKNGGFMYQIHKGTDENGKRIRESKRFKTEAEAREAMAVRMAEITGEQVSLPLPEDIRNYKINRGTLVSDYLTYYLSLGRGNGTSRTRDGYYYAAGRISEEFGDFALGELTPEFLQRFLNELAGKFAQSTIDKVFIVLRTSFKYALDKRYILEDVMYEVKKPKSKVVPEDGYKAYTEEERTTILEAVKDFPELRAILMTLDDTGMRPGELRALKWKNLDWNAKTIRVTNAVTYDITNNSLAQDERLKSEVIGPVKSKDGVRTLSLSPDTLESIKAWQEYVNVCPDYKHARGSEFIFTARTGGFLKEYALKSRFNRFLKATGLTKKGYTFYRFRHTFCTDLIKNGVPIPTVMKLMGDVTDDVIMKIYTHINQNDTTKASESLFAKRGKTGKEM